MPEIIDLPHAEIRKIQDKLLAETMERCAERHPFYRNLLKEHGIKSDEITSIADLGRLPLTYKAELMGDPDSFLLEGEGLPPAERVVWDVAYTTGTTGKPTPFYSTTFDYLSIILVGKRMSEIRGIFGSDFIINLFPLPQQPAGAFLRVQTTAMGIGSSVAFALPGRSGTDFNVHRGTDDVARWVAEKKGTVLWGVPSYIRRLAMRAIELDLDWSSTRYLAISGEPVTAGLRADLLEKCAALGAKDVIIGNSLGMTEMQGGLVECAEGTGFHNPAPDLYHFEIVDEETGQPVPNGQPGLVCLTHLNRRGTVLLRFVIGDISVKTNEPCPSCGREVDRLIANPTRTAHLYKVKATLIDPSQISKELDSWPGITEHRIIFTKEDPKDPYSQDAFIIELAGPSAEAESGRTVQLVRDLFGLSPTIAIVEANAIFEPGSSMKRTTVLDLRPKE